MLDLIIRGASVVDGTGRPARVADVGVKSGKVACVGRTDEGAEAILDADGLALMPGIVDVHTHYDAQVTWDRTLSPSVSLGVTTAVMGSGSAVRSGESPGSRGRAANQTLRPISSGPRQENSSGSFTG